MHIDNVSPSRTLYSPYSGPLSLMPPHGHTVTSIPHKEKGGRETDF
jgi:hypothetical protein